MAGTRQVAVIGAGMAGLACAQRLTQGGAEVVVLDKGRGLGGRIATRRTAHGSFDHGAVALSAPGGADTPDTDAWKAYLNAAVAEGAVMWWPAGQDWVGLPGMSGALRPLAQGVRVRQSVEVTGLAGEPGNWHLIGPGVPETPFDQVILAVPQPQALALLTPWPALQSRIAGARMQAVWTALARFDARLPLEADLITPAGGPIARAVRNAAKPGRAADEAWVIHADADWTAAHLERDKPDAAARLLTAFFDLMARTPVAPQALEGHRWRYGLTVRALGQMCVHDKGLGLAVCGDWCLGDRAGDAFVSGRAAAAAVLAAQ